MTNLESMIRAAFAKGFEFADDRQSDAEDIEKAWQMHKDELLRAAHEPSREQTFERSYEMALERLALASKYIPHDKLDAYETEWKAKRAELSENRGAEP